MQSGCLCGLAARFDAVLDGHACMLGHPLAANTAFL
jgi:hypothetical protein